MNEQNTNINNDMNKESSNPNKENSPGPAIGIIIVILVIILGGWYFLSQKTEVVDDGMTGDEIRQEQDDVTLDLGTQGSTDKVSDIEEDLANTNLDDLNADLENIDTELNF